MLDSINNTVTKADEYEETEMAVNQNYYGLIKGLQYQTQEN